MKRRRVSILLLTLLCGATAQAQVNLPRLPVSLPAPTLPVDGIARQVDTLTNAVTTTADTALSGLRRAQIRALLTEHRDLIEADPNGAPILRRQVVGVISADASLAAAINAGFVVQDDRQLDGVGLRVVTLLAPARMTTARALRQLRTLDATGTYDFNHIYVQSGTGSGAGDVAIPHQSSVAASSREDKPEANARIGLIDGGVDANHPVFRDSTIHAWGCDGQRISSDHGTAVASIIMGHDAVFHGAMDHAALYAADVYCGRPEGGAMTTILAALGWLVQQQVPVINISLVGPPNALLEAMVRNVTARGHLVVAAVGNDGPSAPPLYPASYPDVIGVTAVDARNRVLPEAARGKQVAFAAPGADMAAAATTMPFVTVRGTSFAAPAVAGLLAHYMTTPDRNAAVIALAQLTSQAVDLGSRGTDKTYGRGLVGTSIRVAPQLVSAGVITSMSH